LSPPRGGFLHAATKIAVGAPKAGIRSQAKRTTAKHKYLKFKNKKDLKKIKLLRVGKKFVNNSMKS
jgi:hypothetical protein